MMADPAAPPLTLREIAREVGVAATSVYLHFDSVETLVLEVARRSFGMLMEAIEAAMASATTLCERLRAGALADSEWGWPTQGGTNGCSATRCRSPRRGMNFPDNLCSPSSSSRSSHTLPSRRPIPMRRNCCGTWITGWSACEFRSRSSSGHRCGKPLTRRSRGSWRRGCVNSGCVSGSLPI